MPDHQRVIEFLRDVRQGPLQPPTPEIAQIAADYAALCVQANDRLRQCSLFLQQGLRTEAIHLAEEPPNLLDLVAQLDLPDPQAWADYCQANGLPTPPPLQLDRAAQLNDAYAHDQPLEHLLSQHRHLALSRAPIRQRLTIMRQIAQVDPSATYWDKDIRTFEQARLKELAPAFHAAMRNHDHAALADLKAELTTETWREPPPPDLIAAVSDANHRIQRTGVEAELRQLVESLRDAFAARSLPECQTLVERWKKVMASANVNTIAPDLVDEIKPVIAFVNEENKRNDLQRRFQESCKAFAALLDAEAPDAQLEAGFARLQEFHLEIPDELSRRYHDKTADRRKSSEQRHRTRLLSIAAAALVVIIIGLAALFLMMRASAANQWASKIHSDLALHTPTGLADAQRSVEELQKSHPSLLNQPVVAKEIADLKVQQDQLTRDRSSLASLVDKLDNARTTAAALVANPAAPLPDVTLAAANLNGILDQAKSSDLAWADSEGALATAVATAQNIAGALRDRVVASVQSELVAIDTALRAIPSSAATPEIARQMAAQIAALQTRLDTLRDAPLLDDKTKSDLTALADEITRRRQGAQSSTGIAGELDNIRNRSATAPELKAALTQFITRFPDDPHTADFKRASDLLTPAFSLEAWQQVSAGFNNVLIPPTLTATQKRVDTITAFVAAHPDAPNLAAINAYLNYLQRAIESLGDKGPWQNAFADLIASPLLTDLGIMEVSDGRRYFTIGDPKRVERKFNNTVSVTFETVNLKDFTQRTNVTIDPPLSVSQKPVPAPHTKIMADIIDNLKTINESNWDTFGITLIDQLLRNEQIDLVVKAILIQQILKTQSNVTPELSDSLDRPYANLVRQTPDQLPWLEPARINDNTRRALKAALDEIPPLAASKQKLAAFRTAIFKAVNLDIISAGVLLNDDAGNLQVYSRATPPNGAIVLLIAPATTENATTILQPIGTFSNGKYTPTSLPPETPQGSIIYLTRP